MRGVNAPSAFSEKCLPGPTSQAVALVGTLATLQTGAPQLCSPSIEAGRSWRRRTGVVAVDHKNRRFEVGPRLVAEPPNDGHPAVVALVVHELRSTQVVVQMNFVPRLVQSANALGCCFNPHNLGVICAKLNPRAGSSSRKRMRRLFDTVASSGRLNRHEQCV